MTTSLKELRSRHAVSQAKLSRAFGVTEKTIANWETAPVVKRYIVHAYADYFHVPFEEIRVTTGEYASGITDSQPTLPFEPTEQVIDLRDVVTGHATVNFATAA